MTLSTPSLVSLIIVILWYTHSHISLPAVNRPGPGSGELWSLMVWNKYVFIRCIILASGLRVVFITLNSIEPYFCGPDCLQWILLSIYLSYFIDDARIFFSTREYPLLSFLCKNLPAAGWSVALVYAVCSVVCMCNEKSEIKVPRAWSAFTPLYTGIKLSFYLHITHATMDPDPGWPDCAVICVTGVCEHEHAEHYGLYGGCHVTSPLDYYNRKEMTLTRHEADPQHNYIYTTPRRSPDSKESRAQLVQTSDGRQ